MIVKKSAADIEKMRASGAALAEVFEELQPSIQAGVSLKEIDRLAEKFIRNRGGIPSFLGYRGFPASICASVNEVLVHGIPSERKLSDGDIISIDIGLSIDGWHADRARTYPIGEVGGPAQRLLRTTKASLDAAIEVCRPGKRIGDVGSTVQQMVEAEGFSVPREYSGHGIGRSMHEDPQIPNHGTAGRGLTLEAGMVVAIEPMVHAGDWHTKVLEDDWTVVTADGSLSAHFEDTIAITEDGPSVLTRVQA